MIDPKFIPYEPVKTTDGRFIIIQQDHQVLQSRRQQLGLTQQQVADKAHILLRQYQRLESGEQPFLRSSIRIGLSVCAALLLNPYEFLPGTIRDNEIKLLVIDPLQEFMGVDMNNAQAVRREMSALGRFAAQTGCAIVCIGHFRKETHKKALYHGMGSSDLYAIARSVLHVIDQGEKSSLRYVKCIKSNNEQAGSTFWYEIIDTGVVKWIGPEDAEAADHLEEQAQSSRSPKLDYAVQSLFELLQESEPIPSAEVQKHIRRLGISDATFRRAKKELDIQSVRLGDGWYLQMGQID